MMIIYHSRGSIAAHQAAAIHTRRITAVGPIQPEDAWRILRGPLCVMEGLCDYGKDEAGIRVFAIGRASRHDVVHRSFHGVADVFGLPANRFLLQPVGPPIAWTDLFSQLALLASNDRVVRTLELRALRMGWTEAEAAVEEAQRRSEWRGVSAP